MHHKLDMTEAIDKLAGVHNTFVADMREKNAQLSVNISSLLDLGWSGEAANTFQSFYGEMETAHTGAADGIETWHTKVRSCSRPKGRDAILDSCNGLLKSFKGAGVGMITGILEYEDAVYQGPDTFGSAHYQECLDINYQLDLVQSKVNKLFYPYGVIKIPELKSKISNYGAEYVMFGNQYISAVNGYSSYIGGLYGDLLDAISELESVKKNLKNVEPSIETKDASNPAYRALTFSNLLAQLPLEHRNNIEDIAYSAQEPYKSIFFAYLDEANLMGTNGVLGFGGGSGMSLPWPGFWIDVENDTSDVYINGSTTPVPRWYVTLFHEIGHSIDYATRGYDSSALNTAIADDVRNKLMEVGSALSSDTAAIEEAVQRIMNGKNTTDTTSLQYEIQQKLNSTLNGMAMSNVSDVYGGTTKNVVVGNYKHPDYYWGAVLQALGISPGLELFAENFSNGMTNYTERQNNAQTYLPSADKLLNGDPNDPNDTGVMGKIQEQARNRLGW